MSTDEPPHGAVRIRGLRFAYPGTTRQVLRIPFLDITGTGLTALTGPSGVGKSTLIELLAGTLREPYEGSVVVLGREWRELTGDAERQRHLRRIGLIPQDYGLLLDRTPRQMLAQDLADAGVDGATAAGRITAALVATDMDTQSDRPIAGLSGGQRQRVAIARMLARSVDLVIADEPTANLDPALTGHVMTLFRRLADRIPVLVITHDPRVAAACDRTIVLQSTAEPEPDRAPGAARSRRARRPRVLLGAALIVALAAGAAVWVLSDRGGQPDHRAAVATAGGGTAPAEPAVTLPAGALPAVPITAPHHSPPGSPVVGGLASSTAGTRPVARSSSLPAAAGRPTPAVPTVQLRPTPAPAASQPSPASTSVRYFTPFDEATGRPLVRIMAVEPGSCFTTSLAVDAPGAFRCMEAPTASGISDLHDPCFAPADGGGYVVCVDSPWSTLGVRLDMTAPLPASAGPPGPPTWALALANGAECTAATGTVSIVGEIALRWGCSGPDGAAGGLDRTTQPWTVDFLPAGASGTESVPVVTAWG